MDEAGILTARDMVEMAIQTEQNGSAFYTGAAAQAGSPEMAKLLRWLASQEQEHASVFRTMLTSPERHQPAEQYGGQRSGFVQALLEARVLPDKETGAQRLAAMTGDEEILDFALGFEKDTILFMYEMRDVSSPASRETLDRLIREEKTHVARLLALKHALRHPGDSGPEATAEE